MKKALKVLEMGLGGIGQEMISQLIAGYIPANLPPEISSAVETILYMGASGALKNKHISNVLGGAVAGSSKDIAKKLLARANINLGALKSSIPGKKLTKTAAPIDAANLTDDDMEGY